ncbi:pyridoxal phosphate-dependent decarboxylase family protein [Aeromicrobium sp. CF3.5]|uniref:pyridoxal phosphate-dependent decarboxylase family protein n=1 Tax=Aeromicrobium sp. CF3.5 TaxID=3373078 RepID=UPI003EE62A5D
MTDEPVSDWTPAEFEANGHAVLALIREHFETVRATPVTVPKPGADLMASLGDDLPEAGENFASILADTQDRVIPHLVQWNHPSFHAYFSTSASFPGVLAETLTAALNVNAMLWKSGPAASALERVVLGWIAELAGYPTGADGVLVNGASLATMYALATARDDAIGDVRVSGTAGGPILRIYTSDQAHSSVDKAAITLGIGMRNVVHLPCDDRHRMDPATLDRAIRDDLARGLRPLAVVATVGTTAVGATDPVPEIAEVCARHGIWLHVDAAYGGFWRVAPSLTGSAVDISAADSMVVNPHKTLYVPLEASALYCRRKGSLAATFRLVPEYLTSRPDTDTVDFMDLSPQLGRAFRALKVWWVIRSFGRRGIAQMLESSVQHARWLRAQATDHPDWVCPVESEYPLVCIRFEPASPAGLEDSMRRAWIDDLNEAVAEQINASGDAFVSHAVLDDGYVIRVSIGNIRTTGPDVARLWTLLTRTAAEHLLSTQSHAPRQRWELSS